MTELRTAALVICDGWGVRTDRKGNAILKANTTRFDGLSRRWGVTSLHASGTWVGLPEGQQGNSEVGHLTIGAGRVVDQPLTRISKAIRDGSFFTMPALVRMFERAKANGSTVHCIGLISPGGVHSHTEHALALAELARRQNVSQLAFHCFLDGRDTPPTSGSRYMKEFMENLKRVGVGSIATLGGRYFGMDRDNRWGRIERAYNVMIGKEGDLVANIEDYIESAYEDDITDEFLPPVAVAGIGSERISIRPNDIVICFNFRPDRMRQLLHAFIDEKFVGFFREMAFSKDHFLSFTPYDESLTIDVAFPHEDVTMTLAEKVSLEGGRQLHIAETEKYAHVTYFINGGREEPFEGEDRVLIPSPKVARYDTTPEMSAYPITNALVDIIRTNQHQLYVCNFANADMVGHTGDFKAAVRAVESVDICIGRIAETIFSVGGIFMLTADHGNAEMMLDPETGAPKTAHTTNPVPFLVAGVDGMQLAPEGGLEDVAPTLLHVMGAGIPSEMRGKSLLMKNER